MANEPISAIVQVPATSDYVRVGGASDLGALTDGSDASYWEGAYTGGNLDDWDQEWAAFIVRAYVYSGPAQAVWTPGTGLNAVQFTARRQALGNGLIGYSTGMGGSGPGGGANPGTNPGTDGYGGAGTTGTTAYHRTDFADLTQGDLNDIRLRMHWRDTGGAGVRWMNVTSTRIHVAYPAPDVTTDPATGVTPTAATLKGKVSGYPPGVVYFQWGPTVAYGNTTADQAYAALSDEVVKSQAIAGLAPNTVYHYRIVADNGEQVDYGADQVVQTLPTGLTMLV